MLFGALDGGGPAGGWHPQPGLGAPARSGFVQTGRDVSYPSGADILFVGQGLVLRLKRDTGRPALATGGDRGVGHRSEGLAEDSLAVLPRPGPLMGVPLARAAGARSLAVLRMRTLGPREEMAVFGYIFECPVIADETVEVASRGRRIDFMSSWANHAATILLNTMVMRIAG